MSHVAPPRTTGLPRTVFALLLLAAALLVPAATLVVRGPDAVGAVPGVERTTPPVAPGTPSSATHGPTTAPPGGPGVPAPPTTRDRAQAVLHNWDERRSAAWARGDVGDLTALYTPGAPAGRADVEMLRSWVHRDLVVTGLGFEVLDLRVLRHTGDRWLLVVTDREVGAVASGRGQHITLPRDLPSTRRIDLRRSGPGAPWRVASVRDVAVRG